MARTSSALNNPLSGNIGNQTFKNYGGKQVVVSRFRTTSAKGDGASLEQRLVRLQLPNIVLAGSQLKQFLPCLFEHNKFYKNSYTHFLSHNKTITLPYLRKSDVEKKLCHWGPLVVACGSLPAIRLMPAQHGFISSVLIRSNYFGETYTVGQLSSEIIELNRDFLRGDYLFFISCITTSNYQFDTNAYISSVPSFCSIVLDPDSDQLLSDAQGSSVIGLLSLEDAYHNYYLGVNNSGTRSAAIVHVRKNGTRYKSSPASMVLNSNAEFILNQFSTDAWVELCAQSYGYKQDIL